MRNVLFLLLGLASTGQAKSSCARDSDCLSNEVCARPIGSNVDYCLPVSMTDDGVAPPPLPSYRGLAGYPDPNLGPVCVDDGDCAQIPFARCGASRQCELILTPRGLKQVDRDNIVPYLPTPLDRGLKQDIAFGRRLKQSSCSSDSDCPSGQVCVQYAGTGEHKCLDEFALEP